MTIAVGIFAHQEERRIGLCLGSLPLDRADIRFHILVNGTTDATVEHAQRIAAGRTHVVVHDIAQGGKSRTWNHFVHDLLTGEEEAVIFMDGDAEITPGSIDALVADLAAHPEANAAAGMPMNGRRAQIYRHNLKVERGLFGDLYALPRRFLAAIRERGLRLPDDLVGDDGMVAAWAHTDLERDANWVSERIVPCEGAGFRCEPVSLLSPASWRMQYRRMSNYSVRYFQNRIISDIMGREGPQGLPHRMEDLYGEWLPRFRPRGGMTGWFDRKALARMQRQSRA
ncbi:hypothetical protein FHS51_000053 [Sphingobium wenxiniae]|uniref:Glycosyltransferase 2-like domain-containing protein n=2 Tax=Sphingobium TaxID=165695 RepID=T0GKW8_9SPHN|nr:MULTISPECIES: glycosyltransferase family 2 protein [Sphingobium]EQB04461.1 hypothetical protein L485_04380 [Sphingobium baderi LL03]KMS62888.1 family 2 glycosyl transferase [Sphingobium baderi LL03]MBB6189850.1 hypothetical protein [Sphingobium wenxiniae]TWH97827.1 glycosyltransferase involved in cell wall biosynthesis [Sphingobium wenxiniae]